MGKTEFSLRKEKVLHTYQISSLNKVKEKLKSPYFMNISATRFTKRKVIFTPRVPNVLEVLSDKFLSSET